MRRLYWLLVSLPVIFSTAFATPTLADPPATPSPSAFPLSGDIPETVEPPLWKLSISLTSPTGQGYYPSLAIHPVFGQPYISYYDQVNGDLWITSPGGGSANCGPNANTWTCTLLDNGGANNVGMYSSLDIHLDDPLSWSTGIAYHDATTHSIKFYQRKCVLIYCTTTIQTVLSGSGFDFHGFGISFKYQPSSGTPYIAFHTQGTATSTGVTLMHLSTGSGNCGLNNDWVCDRIESGDMIGENPSLAFTAGGVPIVAYFNHLADALRLAHYQGVGALGNNCGPSPYAYRCRTIDGGGMSVSLITSHSDPTKPYQLAYYEPVGGTLRFAETTSSGNCGDGFWNCWQIDSLGAALSNPGISLVQDASGKPFIAYQRKNLSGYLELYLARRTPGDPSSICSQTSAWACKLVYSKSFLNDNVASFVSMGLNFHGKLQIAFDESDPSVASYRYLDLAQENSFAYLPALQK